MAAAASRKVNTSPDRSAACSLAAATASRMPANRVRSHQGGRGRGRAGGAEGGGAGLAGGGGGGGGGGGWPAGSAARRTIRTVMLSEPPRRLARSTRKRQ